MVREIAPHRTHFSFINSTQSIQLTELLKAVELVLYHALHEFHWCIMLIVTAPMQPAGSYVMRISHLLIASSSI